jgi:hypothetical protein
VVTSDLTTFVRNLRNTASLSIPSLSGVCTSSNSFNLPSYEAKEVSLKGLHCTTRFGIFVDAVLFQWEKTSNLGVIVDDDVVVVVVVVDSHTFPSLLYCLGVKYVVKRKEHKHNKNKREQKKQEALVARSYATL